MKCRWNKEMYHILKAFQEFLPGRTADCKTFIRSFHCPLQAYDISVCVHEYSLTFMVYEKQKAIIAYGNKIVR